MKRIILFTLLSVSGTIVFAQPNFKRGFVVAANGDTLRGYIHHREWWSNPTDFLFSPTPDRNNAATYTVGNAQAAAVDGFVTYERFTVSVSMNETQESRLGFVRDSSTVIDTVFLRVVTRGNKLSLYAYRDKLKDRYYLQTSPDATPEELLLQKDLQGTQLSTFPKYREQLKDAARENPAYTVTVKAKIEGALYAEESLEEIVNALNGEKGTDVFDAKKGARRGRWFAGLGANFSRLSYRGKSMVNADGLDATGNSAFKPEVVTTSVLPVFTGGYDLFFHPSVERTFLRMEAAVTSIRSTHLSYFRLGRYSDEELTNDYKLSGLMVSFNPQLVYHFYQGASLRLFAGAGVMLRYVTYTEQTLYQKTNKQGPGYSDKTFDNYLKLLSFNGIPTARVGVTAGKSWSASVMWLAPHTMSRNGKTEISSVRGTGIQAGVSYLF